MSTTADRVKETTPTLGTGPISFGGAVTGFRAFSSAFVSGVDIYYAIQNDTNTEWEVGIGAVTTGTPWTLARTTVLASSNAGSLVSFTSVAKEVFATLPATILTRLQNSTRTRLTSVAGSNIITAVLTPAITAYVEGQVFQFIAAATNTGVVTINIDGLGVSPVTKNGVAPLTSGDIASGQAYILIRDAVGNFQLSGGSGGGAQAGGSIYENATVINSSYTITAGRNGLSAGPITVANGVTITVPLGSVWTVV